MNRADIAIVGAGPAGISAALNARIRGKSFLLFGRESLSGKVSRSPDIRNYPGFPKITGRELNEKLRTHLASMEIAVTEKRITGIYKMKDYFALLADTEEFDAKTVILATGVEATRQIPGERELLGHGVSYCATCDGNLYRGKTIAVICDNVPMEEEAAFLAELAGKVYYAPLFRDATFTAPNVERLSSSVASVDGQKRVAGITCRDGNKIVLDGVFFLKQSLAPDVLLRGLAIEEGRVVTDRRMATNIPGCFAAGDCTGTPYQITKAVGEGNIAAHTAVAFLAQGG